MKQYSKLYLGFYNKNLACVFLPLISIVFVSSCDIRLLDSYIVDRGKNYRKPLLIDTIKYSSNGICNYSTFVAGSKAYSLEVKTTYLNDSVFLNEKWAFDLNDVVSNQELIFKLGDQIIVQRNHNVRKRKSKKAIGTINLLDNVIRGVSVVKGGSGSFYKIEGAGGCNACSEYSGYFSLRGELLWENYSSRMGNFETGKGNYDKVLAKYNVLDTSAIAPKIKGIWVFPPQKSGEMYTTKLR